MDHRTTDSGLPREADAILVRSGDVVLHYGVDHLDRYVPTPQSARPTRTHAQAVAPQKTSYAQAA